MKPKSLCLTLSLTVITLVVASNSLSAVLGDFNQDGRIDLSEAIYSLQVAAGAYPDIEPSCLLAGKGDWTDDEGTEYIECDVVKHGDSFYVCLQNNTPVIEVNEPPNQDFWSVLTTDCRVELDELTNTVNALKERLSNVDYDGDGFTPNEGDCDDTNAAISPGTTEILDDGIDNNCDGLIDVLCADGETQDCGSDIGACDPGTQTCVDGSWSTCTGGIGPTAEICNGIDDDCNGAVDDGLSVYDWDGAEVWVGDSCGTGACSGGVVVCSNDETGAECSTQSESSNEICDGLDNDCDGLVDEDCCIDFDGDGLGDGTNGNINCVNTMTDSNDANHNVCADTDGDTCDDCSSGTFDPTNDGSDTDGDGICDAGDSECSAGENGSLRCTGDIVQQCNGTIWEIFEDCSETEQVCIEPVSDYATCD